MAEEDEPYWPDEIRSGRVKYPYRIEFEPAKILDESGWRSKRIPISRLGPIYFQGINPIRDKELLTKLNGIVRNKLSD